MIEWILKGTTQKKTIEHCIIFYVQCWISAMPRIRAGYFMAISYKSVKFRSKIGMCLLNCILSDFLLVWFPVGQGLEKVKFSPIFKSKLNFVKFWVNKSNIKIFFYDFIMPQTLKKWGEHISLGSCLRVCMHPFVRDIVLKLNVWIPHGKIARAYFLPNFLTL